MAAARRAAGLTQEQLVDLIKFQQPTISGWESGASEPDPDVVFEIERRLGLKPGALSKFLGYVPVAAVAVAGGFEDAVEGDPYLDPDDREFLLNAYKLAIKDRAKNRRGRRKA